MGRGALTFKGESPKKRKKKNKHSTAAVLDHEHKDSAAAAAAAAAPAKLVAADTVTEYPSSTSTSVELARRDKPTSSPQLRQGTGHITTSGTVVTGHDTRFMKEINSGDAVVVNQEMRVVTMRLSDISINLSSAFTQNYATPVCFQYICKPRSGPSATAKAEAREKATIEGQHAFDIYKGGSGGSSSGNVGSSELVYREKTENGSYRIKRVQVDGSKDRVDLLDLRTKKKSDKYC